MFGSERAIVTLRESYRDDLRATKKITDLQYVRFHAIFHDEVGIYNEDAQGKPFYNFSYADQIYDGLLKNGVRPFVELSFMPKKLAAFDSPHAFWYKPTVAPPKDYKLWSDMITAFAKHLIERYGEDEVAKWYFEVWNEPNIDFWTGDPKEQTYYELYDHTATALKQVSPRLRIGGPATAQAAWADRFIAHCAAKNIPVDFVSTHVYGNDTADNVFGTNEQIPREEMVCRAVKKVHDQIKASAKPNLPLIWSEFNASYMNEPAVTDSTYMGPWLANTIRECDGFVSMMSYWTFSDVFEEQGVVKTPFYGGFGLIAEGGVPKPAFNAVKILHLLGDQRVATDLKDALITRRKDGALVVAIWNLGTVNGKGSEREFKLQLKGPRKSAQATIYRVDATHGDPHAAYEKMGTPASPTAKQYGALKQAAQLSPPHKQNLANGTLNIAVPYNGLAVIEIK
jgi:xylan 1,4-beta-xylosidase